MCQKIEMTYIGLLHLHRTYRWHLHDFWYVRGGKVADVEEMGDDELVEKKVKPLRRCKFEDKVLTLLQPHFMQMFGNYIETL